MDDPPDLTLWILFHFAKHSNGCTLEFPLLGQISTSTTKLPFAHSIIQALKVVFAEHRKLEPWKRVSDVISQMSTFELPSSLIHKSVLTGVTLQALKYHVQSWCKYGMPYKTVLYRIHCRSCLHQVSHNSKIEKSNRHFTRSNPMILLQILRYK